MPAIIVIFTVPSRNVRLDREPAVLPARRETDIYSVSSATRNLSQRAKKQS